MLEHTIFDEKYLEEVASLVQVMYMHTMSMMEMHPHKNEEMFNVHAWRREKHMCLHGRDDLYTSMFEPEKKRDNQDMKSLGWFKEVAVHFDFLFLFLPRKENITVVIRLAGSWDYLSLCVLGWGPPNGAKLQRKRWHAQNPSYL